MTAIKRQKQKGRFELQKKIEEMKSRQIRKWSKQLIREELYKRLKQVNELISPTETEHEQLLRSIAEKFEELKVTPFIKRSAIADELHKLIEKLKRAFTRTIDETARQQLRQEIINAVGNYLVPPETKEEIARYNASKLGKSLLDLIKMLNLSDNEIESLKEIKGKKHYTGRTIEETEEKAA